MLSDRSSAARRSVDIFGANCPNSWIERLFTILPLARLNCSALPPAGQALG